MEGWVNQFLVDLILLLSALHLSLSLSYFFCFFAL